jgi:hypothetical protein
MDNGARITAETATPTSTGVEGAWDVPVSIEIGGGTYHGEVTLLQGQDGSWGMWGDRDMWASQEVLNALDVAKEPTWLAEDIVAEAATEIEKAQD